MNIPLLEKVRDTILEDPRRIGMDTWILRESIATSMSNQYRPPCGTTACIAGWAVRLTRADEKLDDLYALMIQNGGFHQLGREALELTPDQANALFYVMNWPEKFRIALMYSDMASPDYAKAVAARIDHLIATGE